MNYNNERDMYVNKLSSQISGMKKLLEPKFQDIISAEKSDDIRRLLTKAENLRKKLINNEFEVAVIGLEKAGKSTFANALMGNDILPSMEPRCTYTSTSIRYGTDDFAEIIFFTRDEFLKKFVDNLRTMGIEHAENYDYASLSLSKYRELFNRLSDEKKNFYRASINEDVEAIIELKETLMQNIGAPKKTYKGAENLESMDFKKYIQNPAFAVAVKEITIHSSKLVDMQNAVIYDVPGFDSPTQMHREQTVSMMATSDVIIMIANAGKPSITGPQVQIFEGETDQDGIPFNEKIFVFGNKADTANDSIESNVRVLKDQLRKYRIVRPELIEQRTVIGSARAKLEADGKISGSNACDNLKAKGIGNGIDEIHQKLEQYNSNERFEVIKKRINRIYTELKNCLTPELEYLSQNRDGNVNITEMLRINTNLLITSQNKIRNALQSLHNEVPRTFANRLLSEKFASLISNVNSENYAVSEEEKETARNASGTTGQNISLDKFETILRGIKYNDIYNYFIRTVVDIAIETHEQYDEKIKDIFLDALSINNGNPYYDKLTENVSQYLRDINPESREGYYRSLAERFTTDLFETLIRQNFGGRDRWLAFDDRKLNLYSLGIFNTESISELPADRQPMLYSILFHDKLGTQSSSEKLDELLGIIKSNLRNEHDTLKEKFSLLLKKVIREKGEDSAEYLSDLCSRRPHDSDERFINSLYNYLDAEFNDDMKESSDNSEFPRITWNYYDERCKSEELNSCDIDSVCMHIQHDIDILGDILLKAAIPAIQIDKAFVFYVVRSIENILNSIDSENQNCKFGEFVIQNTEKICCGQFADIEVEDKKRRLRIEMCSEIQNILNEVRKYNDNEVLV